MPDINVKVIDNGPLYVTGPVELVDAEGNRFETKAQFALCRCGASKNKPFYDGTHAKIGFNDAVRAQKSQ